MPNDDLTAELARLRTTVAEFATVTADLGRKLGVQQNRLMVQQTRQRRFSALLAVVVAMVLLLAVGVGVNANRIGNVQERTSAEVLCPLYRLLLDSYRPDAVPPDQLAEYEHAFTVLREGAAVLQCPQPSPVPTPSPRAS